MAKKRKATPQYLEELTKSFQEAKADMQMAKGELYMSSVDAKLFDLNFEDARLKAIKATEKLASIAKEIRRVDLALQDKDPELFGDD